MSERNQANTDNPSQADADETARASQRWAQARLLPDRFISSRRARRAIYGWSIILVALAASLVGMTATFWMQGRKIVSQNQSIVAKAQPIANRKRAVALLDQQNSLAEKWSEWVESTRPDDGILQTLAAVSLATQSSQNGIDIQTLNIRLPLEYQSELANPPTWATPQLTINARISDSFAAEDWAKRLNETGRIHEAKLVRTRGVEAEFIQITGEPLSTRTLP